jgi:hypothetical protein
MQRSEAAKKAGTKDVNYSVAPGRSGMLLCSPLNGSRTTLTCGDRWWDLMIQLRDELRDKKG